MNTYGLSIKLKKSEIKKKPIMKLLLIYINAKLFIIICKTVYYNRR